MPARIAADMQTRLRVDLFDAFTHASWAVQSRDREGYLQEVVTNQVTQATVGALYATQLIIALLTFLVLLISAIAISALAALIVVVAAAGLFALLRPLSTLGSDRGHATSQASIAYAAGVNESVGLAEEMRVFGAFTAQRSRVNDLAYEVRTPFFHTQLLARLAPNIYQGLIYLFLAAALAVLYASGVGHVASLGAVVLLLVRAGTYGQQAQGAYQVVRQTLPYLERIQEAQRRYAASSQTVTTRPLEPIQTLAFENVSYAYEPTRPVLTDVTFDVAAGETIGIVGPTGAGKSTVVQILLGLRPPTSGRYLINKTSAEEFRREDWHRSIAYLPQEPRLMHASAADNIRFFRPLSKDAVERAARLAGIHDDIVAWPQGYDTVVSARAEAISGGQQQRLCLARALAAQPEVLVLDEPTSALDPRTEQLIQNSLASLTHELTLFVVAHRMSTLSICDRVMVLVDGRIEAFDTARALGASSAYYISASAPAITTVSDS